MNKFLSPRFIALAAVVVAVGLSFPGLSHIVQLRQDLRTMRQAVPTGDLVVRSGGEPGVPDTLREAEVLRDVIGELAGDHPGRLGDLKLGAPRIVPFGRWVDFSVSGIATFDQLSRKLSWLEGLWPFAHVSSFRATRDETSGELDVELAGHFEFRNRLRTLPELHADSARAPGARDPFRFGPSLASAVVARTVHTPRVPARAPQEPLPGFQGSMVLGGDKIAFFGGKSYRPGDRVAGRLLLDVIDGRPVLGPNEESR